MQCAKTIRLMWKLKTLWLLLALSPCRNLITIVIQCSAAVFSIYLDRAIFLCRKKSDTNEWRGCVSKKAVVLRRWESITGNLVLTTPFIIPNYLINPRLLWFCLPWYVIGPKTPPLSLPIKLKSNPNSITAFSHDSITLQGSTLLSLLIGSWDIFPFLWLAVAITLV